MTAAQNAKSLLSFLASLFLLLSFAPAFAQDAEDAESADGASESSSAGGESGTKTDSAKTETNATSTKTGSTKTAAPKGGGHAHPPAARDHYNRGVELHRSGYLNKAILEYKEAINADEHMEPAYSNLGLVYTAQKSWSKALEAFDKALAMKPDRTTSLNGLGTVLYAMKRNDEAMEKWKKAIEIDPNFASAYYNMGNAYETQEKHREALVAYVKAADINPKMADAYYRMGSLMNKTKHSPQAHVLLNKAIKLAPEAEFARDARKQIDGLQKQFEKDGAELNASSVYEQPEPKASGDNKPKTVATGSSGEKKSDSKAKPDSKSKDANPNKQAPKLIKNPFKKSDGGKDPNKDVNMFVQPPSPDLDLKARPDAE